MNVDKTEASSTYLPFEPQGLPGSARRRQPEPAQEDRFEQARPPPHVPGRAGPLREGEEPIGWVRRCGRFLRANVLPYFPIYGAFVTTVAAFFSIRNYLFLDARFTLGAVNLLQDKVDTAHEVIISGVDNITRKLDGTP